MFLFKQSVKLPFRREYFESVLSGSESGTSTTTAIILGLVATNQSIQTVATAAGITLFIQAFNAASSRYSALRTATEIDGIDEYQPRIPAIGSVLQFFFHMVFGLLPLIPILVLSIGNGIIYTVLVAIASLMVVAIYKVRYIKKHAWQDGVELVLLGILVMLVGLLAGFLLEYWV